MVPLLKLVTSLIVKLFVMAIELVFKVHLKVFVKVELIELVMTNRAV